MRKIDDFALEDVSSWLVRARALDYLHGSLRVARLDGGWIRPSRFLGDQERALSSCAAWHPGLFSQMSRCTTGISLEFETDAQHVLLEVRLDPEPSGTSAVLEDVPGASLADGVSCDADGLHITPREPDDLPLAHALSREVEGRANEAGSSAIEFDLAPGELPELPGLGDSKCVRLWLPALRGCAIRDIWCDGMFMRPVAKRPLLLVLGDSIAQGFVAGDPAWAWPSLVARELGLDLVNQSIGGQVFQPGSLEGLAEMGDPSCVVVALGANYLYEPCSERSVATDVMHYLDEVARLWPSARVWVMGPIWHDDEALSVHPRSCYGSVRDIICHETARHAGWSFVDGGALMAHERSLLADGMCHPNREGAEQIAAHMIVSLGSAAERSSVR